MVVTTIYVVRHAIRANYTVDPITGKYHSDVPSPTGLDGDVPLAAKGMAQAEELAVALKTLPISRFYSSPFYRCLQTLSPFASSTNPPTPILIDPGLGEWYGRARFTHPVPAPISTLATFFPFVDTTYHPSVIPDKNGETVHELHDRIAFALTSIISREDAEDETKVAEGRGSEASEGKRAICIATHAAAMIAIGRTLTGRMPKEVAEDDFQTFTAGITKFVRRSMPKEGQQQPVVRKWKTGQGVPLVDWRDGIGVAGGWDCVTNSDASHLSGGAERGWHFYGDENFDAYTDTAEGPPQQIADRDRTIKATKL